ncbi:UDP-N-acetyl-D-mannosaminuronate dehydrogenase [Prolinoborus sp. 3657]|nr:UDP-N-acetyl-D-mannosaminuronate dehydrogenase [Prolinoborus sp. 3657]
MLTFATLKKAIIGLGYIGLPLVLVFGNNALVVGFDVHQKYMVCK